MMLATDYLKQHHREIEELFRRIRQYPDEDPTTLRIELADMLVACSMVEEDLFYPAAMDLIGKGCSALESTEEHVVVDVMLHRLMSAKVTDEAFRPRLEVLWDIWANHIEEDESELFGHYESEADRSASILLADDMSRQFSEYLPRGHVANLSERSKLSLIGSKKAKRKIPRGQFKPLSLGLLPRVFVRLLAMEDEGIVIFAKALNGCDEMETWFDLTKAQFDRRSIAVRSNCDDPQNALTVRRELAEFFRAVLDLSKVTRNMFVRDFARLLNDLGREDFFGTEGQHDPRGDRRDTGRYDYAD